MKKEKSERFFYLAVQMEVVESEVGNLLLILHLLHALLYLPCSSCLALPCLAATSGSDSQWTTSHCLLTTWMLTNSHWFLPNHKSHVTWRCQVQVHQRSVYFKFFWKFSWLLVAWFLLDGRTSSSQVGRPRRTEPYWRQVVDTPPSPYGRFPWLATNICSRAIMVTRLVYLDSPHN